MFGLRLCIGLGLELGPGLPYSGLFWREKFFANSWHVRSNGNFGGKNFAVPLSKRSHAYLTRVRVTRVRARSREFSRKNFRGQSREIRENILTRKKRFTVCKG